MKTIEFPTIKQLEEAICFCCDARDISYDAEKHEFSYVELVPYPVRDSGGSIDSMGFHAISNTLTFLQAYRSWKDVQEYLHEEYPDPVPVDQEWEDNGLPF